MRKHLKSTPPWPASAKAEHVDLIDLNRSETAEFEANEKISSLATESIVPSRWANRHSSAFLSKEFEELKSSIRAAGVNIQPIKVRPWDAQANGGVANAARFEIVFGHRRHRACSELGFPVRAVIQTLSDKDLFVEMERENRTQRGLSPYEQGQMYEKALSTALYATAKDLAQDLAVDASLVSKALTIARLPEEVIAAFPTPLDIQYRWAGPLNDACKRDKAALISRASLLHLDRSKLGAVKVFQRLVAQPSTALPPPIYINGVLGKASIETDRRGNMLIVLQGPTTPALNGKVEQALREILTNRKR